MSQSALPISAAPLSEHLAPVPLRELAPWTVLLGTLGLLVLFFVGVDQGAVSVPSGSFVHELAHDGRHLLGYPCH
ncbi:CbtB-domain containing protein [uncultured Nocardioides sp.]|jgi:hypothetical protein|uniref:CbtB domain-containing protein n=1 Tax=uncultured Nocardioides sp. TaxID=198441 RepID=UPI000C680A63|nr:CbtB-domain containing protein [uncultured Nocardioides sp.]MAO81378.1 cobalt transporter [Nocardioides sp.]